MIRPISILFILLVSSVMFAQQKPGRPLTTRLSEEKMAHFTQRIPSKESLNDLFFNLPESTNYEVQRAFNMLQTNDQEAAKVIFEKFAQTDWMAACGLATYYVVSKDISKGIDILNDAATRFSSNESIISRLGNLYYKNKEFVKAEEQFIKLVNQNLDNTDAWYMLGMLYLSVEDLRNYAEFAFIKVVNTKPNDKNAPIELARLYSREADTDRALMSLGKGLENGFDNRQLLNEDKDLVNLRATEQYGQLMKVRFGS